MSTTRLESFSDAVIAVAATLLVLNLVVPAPRSHDVAHGLAHALGRAWPAYGAYAVSFITIGIIWINHHVMIGRLRVADHSILILNLVLLLTIGLLPFATNLLSTYLNQGHGQKVAATIYAGAFLLMSVAFALLNWHILMHRTELLRTPLPYDERRRILLRSVSGLGPYVLATGVAFVSPYATLAICAAVAFFYALPLSSGLTRGPRAA